MPIITESKATRRLTILLVMIMGVAMIIPSNLTFASPDDGSDEGTESGDGGTDEGTESGDGGTDEGTESGDGDSSDEGTAEDDQTESEESEEQLTEEQQTCPDGSVVSINEACPPEPVSSFVTCSDASSGATQTECPSISTAAQEQLTCPDGSVVSINEACPPTDKPLSNCDGSFQDCITPYGDVCPAGSAAHECELPEPVSREPPNNGCLFNTELPKCAPIDGKCPDGFGMNEDGRCFPEHSKCPDGYHTTEDDETGECNPNSECVGDDYLLVNDDKSCREKRTYCLETPTRDECKDDDNDKTKVIHKTIVIHGASASASATATATAHAAEVSSCRLDGNAHGMRAEV